MKERPWRAITAALAAMVAGGGAAQSANAGEPVRILVAAGNNVGLGDEPVLRYAVSDAERVAQVFVELGAVTTERVVLVRDGSPDALLRAVAQAGGLAARYGVEDTTVLVYYSGHGDAEHLHQAGERLPLAALEEALGDVRAGLRLMIVDACRSSGRSKGLREAAPFAIDLKGARGPQGLVTVRSSSDGEASQESDALRGGVFTHYLVSGLRGAADRDRDTQVSLSEAYAWAYSRTLRRSAAHGGDVQHAAVDMQVAGAGEIVLTRTAAARSRLRLPVGSDLQYLVYRLPSGNVVAEAWASPDGATQVALPAGRFLVQRRGAGQHGAVEVSLAYGGEREVVSADFEAIPLAELVAKGGGLQLSEHELLAGYGFLVGAAVALGHRLRVRYAWRRASFALGVGVDVGLSGYTGERNVVSDRWLGGDVRVDWRIPVEPVELRLGLGAAVAAVGEELQPVDSERWEQLGQPTTSTSTALGAGPIAWLGVRVPISEAWSWDVGASWTGLFVPRTSGVSVMWNAALETGAAWAF